MYVNVCMFVTVCSVRMCQPSVDAYRLLVIEGAHTAIMKNHQHAANLSKCCEAVMENHEHV